MSQFDQKSASFSARAAFLGGMSGAVGWLVFFAAILLSWAIILAMAFSQPGNGVVAFTDPGFWASLCLTPAETSLMTLTAMWVLMSMAMMMPTFVPTLKTYQDMTQCGAADRAGFFGLVTGYLAIWFGFALFGAGAQMGLHGAGLVAPDGSSLSGWLTGALLLAAGIYQFSTFKHACLRQCQHPLTFFMQHWQPGPVAAVRMGLRLGALCLACCWALMLLAFVGGTMNLIWMGAATVFMTFEKLPDIGKYVTLPLGFALITAGLVVLANTAGIF